MNATLGTADGRAVLLRMERRFAHQPEKVWRALTRPEELSQWYPFRVEELDLRLGGRIRFDDGQGGTLEAVITELEPPRVLAFTQDAGKVLEREGDNLLRFELRPDGDGCLLTFTHHFHDRPRAGANAAGWDACLDALGAVVDGRPVPPAAATTEVPAGTVAAAQAPTLLEYDWRAGDRPAGRVRWEPSGDPAGARITLTQTGPAGLEGERSTALAAWRSHLQRLAGRLYREAG